MAGLKHAIVTGMVLNQRAVFITAASKVQPGFSALD
jgi:hypothetical protein